MLLVWRLAVLGVAAGGGGAAGAPPRNSQTRVRLDTV